MLEFLLRGGVDVVDKLIYSLRDAGHSQLARSCLREPEKLDQWNRDEDDEEKVKENLEDGAAKRSGEIACGASLCISVHCMVSPCSSCCVAAAIDLDFLNCLGRPAVTGHVRCACTSTYNWAGHSGQLSVGT